MARALVVSDEVDHRLTADTLSAMPVDLLLSAGDLPVDYLEFLVNVVDRPAVLVPGNHDPELGGFRWSTGQSTAAGIPTPWPGPGGWRNADGSVVEVAGLRIAGLGGCVRYGDGPNQWTQAQQARRGRRLVRRGRRGVDVLLAHAPPRGVGDGNDPAHHGFDCLHELVRRLRPRWLLHGHVHPYGDPVRDRALGETTVRNVVGSGIVDIDVDAVTARERR